MAFSLKNLGQRLLDSTTLDEKASQFFRPKTGTLATVGRQWAQELAAKPAPSWVPQQVQQTAQNISDRGGFNRLRQEFKNPIQFTPLSMKSAAVDTGRSLGSEDLGYGLRGALSLTPFQSFGKLTPKLSAIQQTTAPTTSRQQTAQSIGQTAYGTALTAPLSAGKTVLRSVGNVARNLAVGGTTGALMQGGSDLLTGNFSKESLKQGALSGLQNSWVLPVTNSITDAAILKLFPKAGLKITGAGVTDPFKLGKIKEGFGRLLAQSLAQVPAENTAFTFLNQLDDKTKGSFTENWMNNLPGNIAGNILSAGVSGSVNVFSNPQSRKIVTDALKKTVDEWNTPVTMMGGEKMPMWKYKMMYETKPGFAALDLGLGKDKLSVEPTGGIKYKTENISDKKLFKDRLVETPDSYGNDFIQIRGKNNTGISSASPKVKIGLDQLQNAKDANIKVSPVSHGDWDFGDGKGKLVIFDTGVSIQKQYFDRIRKEFPNAEFFVNGKYKTSPIVAKENGQVVGAIMPIMEAKTKNIVEFSSYSKQPAKPLSVEPTGKLDAQTLKEYESIKNSEYFSDNKNLAKSLIELENFKDTTTYKALDQLRKDRGIKDVYSEAVAKFTTPEALPTKQVDLKGFGENLDPKNKSRATILLSGKTRIDGGSEVITKAEKIEKLLGQGYKPETINGKPVLKNASGNFYEVTKIESDYAKHLSQSSPSKPLSVEPVGGKPDISNKVQQNIDSGMSVDEAVRKAQSETTTPIKNKSSKFTSAEEYARDEGVRAKAGIVSEKQRSDFFGSEGIPNGYNARSFYENRMRKAGFSEDQISKVLSRVEERPGTGAGAGMKSEDVADAMAEHNLSIRDQLRAEYNQSSPLGNASPSKPPSVEPVGGKPIVAYHGSDTKIENFDLSKAGSNTDSGMFGKGVYFSGSPKEASTYARKTGNVTEYQLNLKNPYIIKSQADIPDIKASGTKEYSEKFTKYLQDKGFDGVIDEISPNKQYVVFDPKQITPSPLRGKDLLAEARKLADSGMSEKDFVETFAVRKRRSYERPYLKWLQEKAIETFGIPKKIVGSDSPEWTEAFKNTVNMYEKPLKEDLLRIRKQDLLNADANERAYLSKIYREATGKGELSSQATKQAQSGAGLKQTLPSTENLSQPNYTPSPLGGNVGEVISTTKPQIQTQSPELQRINTQIEAPKPVVSSDSIITPAGNLPKRSGQLKKQLAEAQQGLEQSQVIAEQNKLIRDNFSSDQIKEINQLKMLAKKSLDQGGDIETLRGKYPKLVESVTSSVREADQTITGDSEALDFALSLPTKAETKVNMTEVKKLQKQLDPITKLDEAGVAATTGDKSVISAIVEPTPKTIKGITTKQQKLDIANEVRARKKLDDEWQKAVFGEAQTRTTKQAEKELEQAIKRSTNEATFKLDTADSWKDKNALSLGTETMDRNFEDIMGKQAPELKKKLLEPVYKSEAQRTKFLNTEREQIKKLGIKAGSKESSLVQEYGEGNITAEQLRRQTTNPDKIIKASEFIRGKYDEYLGQLNKVLTRNGYEPIPKRSDYFHHFQELSGAFDLLGVSLKAQDLPTDINGLTADFKPGKTFFSAALRRLGGEYTSDAIGGIDKYLEGASNQIYHTDNIQALRSFENALREKYAGTQHLSNFVANLSEYTNGIAGKKSMIDRAAESIVGRGIYGAATGLKRQVGANMVGANVSSALTNFIPLTQTLATTDKGSVLNAIMATIKNVGQDDGFIQASDFLTTRHGTDRLAKSLYENVADKAGWLFKNVDSFVSQVVTRSKYLEAIKKGMSEEHAMATANSWAKKLMAGRGKGEMPTLFNSQTLGAITQFQLEVKNQLSFMTKDIPRNFDKVGAASAIAQLFLYGYLFNNLYEKMTGRRPAFDPIGVIQRTYEDYTNPDMKKGQATKNLVQNVSNQLPFVSTFTGGRLPITSAIPNPMAVVNGESTLKKELLKPVQFVLPTGGGQIKKSIEGIGAYNKGVSTSPSGRVRFPIPQTTANRIRTTLFGQWSTPEAQKYLREGQGVLGEKQTKQVLESGNKVAEFAKIKAKSLFDKKIDAEKEVMKAGDKKVSEINGVYLLKQDNGDIETIDISKEITAPKLTGQTEIDKKLKSSYKGKITSRINDIVKLVDAGQLDAKKAESMIKELQVKSAKMSGGKKPKVINIKTPKRKAIKFKLSSSRPTLKLTAPKTNKSRLSLRNYKVGKIKV